MEINSSHCCLYVFILNVSLGALWLDADVTPSVLLFTVHREAGTSLGCNLSVVVSQHGKE